MRVTKITSLKWTHLFFIQLNFFNVYTYQSNLTALFFFEKQTVLPFLLGREKKM